VVPIEYSVCASRGGGAQANSVNPDFPAHVISLLSLGHGLKKPCPVFPYRGTGLPTRVPHDDIMLFPSGSKRYPVVANIPTCPFEIPANRATDEHTIRLARPLHVVRFSD